MINEHFVLTFRASDNRKLTDKEIEYFEKEAGYSPDMSDEELEKLYDDIHAEYDITMDEMDENDNIAVMPTYNLIMKHMEKWFNE